MGGLSAFMAQNAKKVENIKVAVSDRFTDVNGKPIDWDVRCITSGEDEVLRRDCTRRVPVPGKRNQYTQELDTNLYLSKFAAACTVFPNLNDADLQDSYKVKTPEALISAMLSPGEYAAYVDRLQVLCGFDRSLSDQVDEAKN